jgi:hypothetical protein
MGTNPLTISPGDFEKVPFVFERDQSFACAVVPATTGSVSDRIELDAQKTALLAEMPAGGGAVKVSAFRPLETRRIVPAAIVHPT